MELKEQTKPGEPSAVVLEIRGRMAQLDRADEIVRAVNSMRSVAECFATTSSQKPHTCRAVAP